MGIAKGPFPLDLRQNQIGFPALECKVMPSRDTRIDAYIAKSAAFAKPILEHLRALVHEACPDVEETLKWSAPHFTHAGKILAGMAAFKQHAGFIVPMLDASAGDASKRTEAMGHYGRITVLADLPARRVLIAQLKQAAKAIDGGAKLPNRKRDTPKPVPTMPALPLALTRRATPVQKSSSRRLHRASNASTSNGSPKPSRKPRAQNALPRPAHGSPRAKHATGSTRSGRATLIK